LVELGYAAAAILLVYLLARLRRWKRKERIYCETKDAVFEVDMVRRAGADLSPGAKMDLTSCTAFGDPNHVECDKPCLVCSDQGLEIPGT